MRVVNSAQRTGGAAGLAGIAAIFLIGAVARGGTGDRVGASLVAVFFALWAFRMVRLGVLVRGPVVEIRDLLKTTILSWTQIRDVVIVDSGNVTGRATCVAFVLESGSVIRASGTASFQRSKVEQLRALILNAKPGAS